MFKYITLFLIYILSSFYTVNADYIDVIWWENYNERFVLSSSSDFTNSFSWKLFLKNITCSLDYNFSSSDLFKIDLYYSWQLKNHFYIEKKWTLQFDINSYISNSYRVFTSISWTNWYNVICNFNWILFDDISNFKNYALIQNDLLWFILFSFWFFILFVYFWKLYKKFSLPK